MAEVVVIASLTAEPGKEREAEEALRAIIEPSHAEDGCLLYALHRGTDDPRRLSFVERWSSREQLNAHLGSPHMQEGLARLGELFGQNIDIVFYEPIPAGDAAKGSLAGNGA
jgi:quinol monooxygenase YgiN